MFKTTKEILDHITSFHQRLNDIYFRIEDLGEKERLDLMLVFMEQHKKRLQENLNLFEKETPDKIKNIWLTYISNEDLPEDCRHLTIDQNMTVLEVINTTLKFEECIIHFYEKVVEKCPFPEVRNIFENLLNLAKREKLDTIKNDHNHFYV